MRKAAPAAAFYETRTEPELKDAAARLARDPPSVLAIAGGDGTVNALVASAEDSLVCWRFIDPYGDIIFNHLQASVLIAELDELVAAGQGAGSDSSLDLVDELAVKRHSAVRIQLK